MSQIFIPGRYPSRIFEVEIWEQRQTNEPQKHNCSNSRTARRGPAFGQHDLADVLYTQLIFPLQVIGAYREHFEFFVDYLSSTESISKTWWTLHALQSPLWESIQIGGPVQRRFPER